jgi:glycine cleavage system aminomethyltransferase T
MKLAAASEKGREVGRITSATRSEKIGKEIALGYVKRGFNESGTQLDALACESSDAGATVRVEVVRLPFV